MTEYPTTENLRWVPRLRATAYRRGAGKWHTTVDFGNGDVLEVSAWTYNGVFRQVSAAVHARYPFGAHSLYIGTEK